MTSLIDHVEKNLGTIKAGWTTDAKGLHLPFQVVETTRGPIDETVAFLTIGLSNSPLTSVRTGRLIRQELTMVVRTQQGGLGVPSVLQQVASAVLASGQPLLRGDVLGPSGPLFERSSLEALYVAIPVYFKEAFAACDVPGVGSVIFAWLIPISRDEAEYVRVCGWERFEDRLADENPDLVDVFRAPMHVHS